MAYTANILDSVHSSDPIGFWPNGNLDAKRVVDFMHFTKKDVAQIANIKPISVRYDKRIPHQIIEHMSQVANICSLVAELLNSDIDKTVLWLNTPNPAIGGISPKAMIRLGKYDKLLKFVINAKSNSSS